MLISETPAVRPRTPGQAVPFHPLIADWFAGRFLAPTDAQARAWPALHEGRDALISAPTGSGKTLAAFLVCLDRLVRAATTHDLDDRVEVVYVSPLKALSNDVQKNLEVPLAEITALAFERGQTLAPIRTAVRTGDTTAWERQQIVRKPPHVLVTTPESLFILLTAERSRRMLSTARVVIVDEIHAVADDKRGSHLALSLTRLDHLVRAAGGARPQRIGLSATVNPLADVAAFLRGKPAGASDLPEIDVVDEGHRRTLDLAVEVPRDELGAVASNEMWAELYDRMASLVEAHRTTLVFVNTRRLAERVAHHLEERLGSDKVLAHHGSLSRKLRLTAEQRLKGGQLKAIVATASLELGIDIGSIDLVCQVGSPRAIGTALQRIGRAGHRVDRPGEPVVPKGRLFATTRDELVECAAIVRAIRAGELDRLEIPPWPLDVLAQQIVAMAACESWREDDLFDLVRTTAPYAELPREEFDDLIAMLADGITHRRGRSGAYLHRDRVNGIVRGRRGARLAAITSGGAIPDNANYLVTAEPEGLTVGTVDEDFAVESLVGDVFLLGTTSWRIRRVEPGRVRVEDAHGAAPNIPFWRGEAPARTMELSREVSRVREEIARLSREGGTEGRNAAIAFMAAECGLDRAGAEQAVDYVRAGAAAVGAVPAEAVIVAERFFDESGGMQLVLHAPLGARINRAWGLALRKRFCRTFNFELQAAATDNGIVISLSDQHSFPLDLVFRFLNTASVEHVLTQAMLDAPMFTARWRWNVSRALAVLRFAGGRKVPLPLQRMRSDDLLAAVFPDQVACAENLVGEISIPDHPLVKETIRDCLHDAMDIDGLRALLEGIEAGTIRTVSIGTSEPSPFSHEILNANPYAYLDDAPLEERRARAVQMRRTLGPDASDMGALDPAAIAAVAYESWPVVRDADELHDALLTLAVLPPEPEWEPLFHALVAERRATLLTPPTPLTPPTHPLLWIAAERLALGRLAYPGWDISPEIDAVGEPLTSDHEGAVAEVLRGWLESIGPATAAALASRLGLDLADVDAALLRLESEGQILRGHFTPESVTSDDALRGVQGAPRSDHQWCNRRLLARIHRLTLGRLRREIEPVTAAEFTRFLSKWQHVAPGTQLHGEDGLLQILKQLQGYEVSASAWESDVLCRRVARYEPEFLDKLCLAGEIVWGRLSPHPAFDIEPAPDALVRVRRVRPTRIAPVALFLREDADWLLALERPEGDAALLSNGALSHPARDVLNALDQRGASFVPDLVKASRRLPSEVEDGLWELVAAGLVTADGFDNLRSLVDPKRRRGEGSQRLNRPRHAAGRWARLLSPQAAGEPATDPIEALARQFLLRWGVVFRDLLARESVSPPWREMLIAFRRFEARGEIRGGRFVAGFVGEQFARPEAVDLLRAVRRADIPDRALRVSAADPLNLAGIVLPGPRVSALATTVVDLPMGA